MAEEKTESKIDAFGDHVRRVQERIDRLRSKLDMLLKTHGDTPVYAPDVASELSALGEEMEELARENEELTKLTGMDKRN